MNDEQYHTLVATIRNCACIEPTGVIEIVPMQEHTPWSSLEIRDVWTKHVYGRVLFVFDTKPDSFERFLSSIDVADFFGVHEGMIKSREYFQQKGATRIGFEWLRFKVTYSDMEDVVDENKVFQFIFQVVRRGSEESGKGSGRIPVTIWANATVKHQTAINARTPGEACARALKGRKDWYVHSLLPDALSQPQPLAGPAANMSPPKFLAKSCLNCKHLRVDFGFRGSEVTPPETTNTCTKRMTIPVGLTATFCPGWEEGKPVDETDKEDDAED